MDEKAPGARDPLEEPARDLAGQDQIPARVDEAELRPTYANGFRPIATAEEVVLDFGFNLIRPDKDNPGEREIVFHPDRRVVMNYYVAKRLAIAMGHIVRTYEQEFGEIELEAAKRRRS